MPGRRFAIHRGGGPAAQICSEGVATAAVAGLSSKTRATRCAALFLSCCINIIYLQALLLIGTDKANFVSTVSSTWLLLLTDLTLGLPNETLVRYRDQILARLAVDPEGRDRKSTWDSPGNYCLFSVYGLGFLLSDFLTGCRLESSMECGVIKRH